MNKIKNPNALPEIKVLPVEFREGKTTKQVWAVF
jgi:hypothetical protein